MIYRFDAFEVDTALHELRAHGVARPIQPQAFAVLRYLIEHRDRVVSKRELLDALWPDTFVTDSSVQRAVSVARAAIDDEGARIRTIPRQGYRFVAEVESGPQRAAAEPPFRPRFAKSGDAHIAFHTLGEGELDVVVIPGWVFPMRAFLDLPAFRAHIEALTRFGRVVLFDKRGTGLSDRVSELPPLEQRMDDLSAVLDKVGSREALLVGYSEGGPLSVLFATLCPERVRGLLLAGSFARWTAAPGYEAGWAPARMDWLRRYISGRWGAGDSVRAIVESHASDPEVVAWAARAEQEGASPGAALALFEMNRRIDVRPLLPAVSVPTAVVHHSRDAVVTVENGRYLAEHIPGARLFELDGLDHVFAFEGQERVIDAMEWLLSARPATTERFLTTVLAAETPQANADALALDEITARFRGVRAAESLAWSFDGPQRAIRCGHALAAMLLERGVEVRLGVHTGEVARTPRGVTGDAVRAAAALARSATPGEVWVSRVVRDLVHGSALRFDDRAPVALDGKLTLPALASIAPR